MSYISANVLTPEKRLANNFSAAFHDVQSAVSQRERLGLVWPLWEVFENKTKKPMKIVDSFIEPIIADVTGKKNDARREEKVSGEGEGTLLDHLVQVTSDPKVLKDET